MKIFLDSGKIEEIEKAFSLGVIDGVTTNPSLLASNQTQGGVREFITKICKIVNGPVSVEVLSTQVKDMIKEGMDLSTIAPNICIKLPITVDGLKACKYFTTNGIMTNMTLCFSVTQAILAAKAGATFISPFIGRWDDISITGTNLIADIRVVYDNYSDFKTQILAASIRHPLHIVEVAKMGTDVITIPESLISKMIDHPLTEIGLNKFLSDWQKMGK